YTLYDSLLRPLQTQSPTPRGGRLLTDTRYDTRGLAYDTYADIFDTSSTPNSTYTRAEYGEAPTQTQTVFDGAGRATTSSLYVYGVKKWSTTTTYTGDSVATTALEGGSARRTITDVRGQTTESREYASTSPADSGFGTGPGASYTFTKFTYALDGQQKSITGPDGAKWTYDYDLFGRQISTGDPDKGTTTTEYNALDQIIKSTDSRGTSLLTAYDELGRATGTWTGSKTDANQLTGYTYDTVLKGLPTSSTRYVGGKTGAAYTQTVTAYDSLDRATATQLELPASDPFVKAGAPSTLAFETYYNIDGTQQYDKQPALGGLPSEIIGFTYDGLGNLTSIGGSTGYLNNVSYSALTQPEELTLGTGGTGNKNVYVKNSYEEGTGRLLRSYVKDQTRPYMLQDLNYTYDQTGNVTAISDPTTLGGTSSPDTQCFAYDGHQRLTEAWTPASQKCSDAPNASSLSGPAPYWTSYTYNTAGQRTSETVHQSSGDTKTTYCYTNAKQPHTLTGTTTKADCASPQRTYDYDTTGNTRHRPGTTATQELDWSPEGKLTKLTENATSTDYLYAADGTLLIRATKNGERILYAGATELHLRVNGTTWAQRYYTAGAVTAAVRSNESGTNKLTYLTGDHHGTSTLAISPDTAQAFTKRYTTPFGADRGTPLYGPWPDDKGFLGKTRDTTTGLTHIGAREYDPTIGQFISIDPILDLTQPHSLNGYSYASNSPVTLWDPTGLNGVGGGNPGTPGNSGSKKPYGGMLGGYGDAPSGPYPMPPVSAAHVSGAGGGSLRGSGGGGSGATWFETLAVPGPEPDGFEGAFLQAYTQIMADRQYAHLWPSQQLALAGSHVCEDLLECTTGQRGYFAFELFYSPPGFVESLIGPSSDGIDASAAAGVFAMKVATRSGKPTWASRAARGRQGSITGTTRTETHWARVEVSSGGVVTLAYTLRSGSQTAAEKALGRRVGSQVSHTEHRVARMSGATRVQINNDPYANLARVKAGDTVTITGMNPPCGTCQNAMTTASSELSVTFVYKWGNRQWSTSG
ncbi:RHS repeat-associated core domain-containing protein, partial [Streptomyces kebangsaanensis]|uniref:RHS repeat-associated core domain-containing protein n=1 Tax=Streptomyces kebangsaanensis TaxID=864058 RepID=UPI000A51B980